jgi:hypothetical protein
MEDFGKSERKIGNKERRSYSIPLRLSNTAT